jgi:hypothetical protein
MSILGGEQASIRAGDASRDAVKDRDAFTVGRNHRLRHAHHRPVLAFLVSWLGHLDS